MRAHVHTAVLDPDAIFEVDDSTDMAPTPGVIGRKAVSAADKSAQAAAPAAAAPAATPAVVAKKLHANASSEAVLKEVVRLEAALKVTQQALDETRAKEAATTADLGKVRGTGSTRGAGATGGTGGTGLGTGVGRWPGMRYALSASSIRPQFRP